MSIDFHQIAPRAGGQTEAFEELCCQLAARQLLPGIPFVRLRGEGGDGGVECFSDAPNLGRFAWQAKFVFNIASLLRQAANSLDTALTVHPKLTKYIICFPFDLTGPTARRGQSSHEKFQTWKVGKERAVRKRGRKLTIEAWPAAKLRQMLLDHDNSGGLRAFFFNQTILTPAWFSEHITQARQSAGPRYSPELNVETPLWKWFAAFGRTSDWMADFNARVGSCREAQAALLSAVQKVRADKLVPAWPAELKNQALTALEESRGFLDEMAVLASSMDNLQFQAAIARLDVSISALGRLEAKVYEGLEQVHGKGRPDSPGFRQFMAEYQISFPMANLDRIRELLSPLRQLHAWLTSPAGELALHRVFVLAGAAGSGKTHGICDAAERRARAGMLTCVLFGHQFQGEPDPWIRLRESLDLPASLCMNGTLDALNAAAEASGHPLILCIDAINETRPLPYWRERIAAFVTVATKRSHIRVCFSCRTSFLPFCLPNGHDFLIAHHKGFEGVERQACQAFFDYYNLVPPIAPILAPELSNPLYLKLVCQTLKAKGLRRLPTGWHGLAPAIAAFLEVKEQAYAETFSTSTGARVVTGSLMAIARAMARFNQVSLTRSQAQAAIASERPGPNPLEVLEWLIRADLLIEDASSRKDSLDAEDEVRPAFERLGDFLVADELLKQAAATNLDTQGQPGGLLHALVADADSRARNAGVLNAIAILIPERQVGIELPDLFRGQPIHRDILRDAINTLHLRDPATFTGSTQQLIRHALAHNFAFEVFDAVIAVSWQPSRVDALWLDTMLRWKPLVERDGFWCAYLHSRCEARTAVTRLIEAAFELPLSQLDKIVSDRWTTTLIWFTASADRRVKDKATRAATKIMASVPSIIPVVLARLIDCDDDEVRERLLLVVYGALLLSHDRPALQQSLDVIHRARLEAEGHFDNALIRDDVRCIAELAIKLGVIGKGEDVTWASQPINGAWPLELPTPTEVKRWGEQLFEPDESISDFYKYSMNCLSPWIGQVPKKHMGHWILQRVARDFGYEGSTAARFDEYMIGKFGSGRAKPAWAERIGKKYQWIAMYQLASRLQDHVERKQEDWDPKPAPQRPPLILLDERKMDPTMWRNESSKTRAPWWISRQADLGNELSDKAWCARKNDVPTLEDLQSALDPNSRHWRLLHAYPEWSTRKSDEELDQQYRYVWAHIHSYLVPEKDLRTVFAALRARNFMGDWMPGGSRWLYGFAAEYPWAAAFNTEPDSWYRTAGLGKGLPAECYPTWNDLTIEFEYDATKSPNYSLALPGRPFFGRGDLWWNGQNGFSRIDGKSVLFDPSIDESGPASLLADTQDLQSRLKHENSALLWIMFGEKRVVRGTAEGRKLPVQIFSQIASLDLRGALRFGPLTFFEKYDEDASPRTPKKNIAQRPNRTSKRSGTHGDRKSTATSATPKKLTRTARRQRPRRKR